MHHLRQPWSGLVQRARQPHNDYRDRPPARRPRRGDGRDVDEPVHLVGHDWGSVVAWEALCRTDSDPRLGRIASLTSISGPCLAHVGASRRASWRSRDGRRLKRDAAAQAVRSCGTSTPSGCRWPTESFAPAAAAWSTVPGGHGRGFEQPDDAVNGLHLYRAKCRTLRAHPRRSAHRSPTPRGVPSHDRYVGPAMTPDGALRAEPRAGRSRRRPLGDVEPPGRGGRRDLRSRRAEQLTRPQRVRRDAGSCPSSQRLPPPWRCALSPIDD